MEVSLPEPVLLANGWRTDSASSRASSVLLVKRFVTGPASGKRGRRANVATPIDLAQEACTTGSSGIVGQLGGIYSSGSSIPRACRESRHQKGSDGGSGPSRSGSRATGDMLASSVSEFVDRLNLNVMMDQQDGRIAAVRSIKPALPEQRSSCLGCWLSSGSAVLMLTIQ